MTDGNSASFKVRFEGTTPAQANRLAADLEAKLRQVTGGALHTQRVRGDERTQNLGEILEFLVDVTGTRFAVEISKGIRDFIARSGSRVVIDTPAGTVRLTGEAAANADVAALLAALQNPGAPAARE